MKMYGAMASGNDGLPPFTKMVLAHTNGTNILMDVSTGLPAEQGSGTCQQTSQVSRASSYSSRIKSRVE